MAQALKPKSLNPRQYQVILLHHKGLKRQEIAKATGYRNTRISQTINSEPGREYLEQLRAEERAVAAAEGGEGLRALLEAEAVPSLNKLRSLRDASESHRVQLSAANSLLDRTVPRKVTTAPAAPQFVLSDKVAEKLLKAMEEDRAIDAAIDVMPHSLEGHPKDD